MHQHVKVYLLYVALSIVLYLFYRVVKYHQNKENIFKQLIFTVNISSTNSEIWTKIDKGTTLAYIHIPKTAGGSFKRKIHLDLNETGVNDSFIWYPGIKSKSWNTPGCHGFRKCGGTHCGYTEIQDCFDKKQIQYKNSSVKYISIIRDPVERVISEYFYWKDTKTRAWSKNLKKTDYDFKKWILHEDNTAHNRQFKTFVNLQALDDKVGEKLRKNDCFNYAGEYTVNFWRNIQLSELQDNVFQNIIKNFGFIGLFENMYQSVEVLGYILQKGVKHIKYSKHEHSSDKEKVSAELRKLIYERNLLDYAVYDFVKIRLMKTAENMHG